MVSNVSGNNLGVLLKQKQNKLRDAQIEAIKTYLYLKIACDNKPLWRLFYEGTFNSLELDTLKISHNLRKYLKANPQALSLYQYALYNNKQNLIQCIEKEYNGIDYKSFFMKLFYEVDYTDYLFSLDYANNGLHGIFAHY